MLLLLPIIPSRISQNFYPLFLIHSCAITYYSSIILNNFIHYFSDNGVHNSYSSWLMIKLVWLRLILSGNPSEKLHCYFPFHYQFNVWHISLHSAILVPNTSFIMLVNILLFQHYSHQIYNLLFAILCQHNRLRPNHNKVTIQLISHTIIHQLYVSQLE